MKSDLDALMQARNLDAMLVFGDAENNPPMYYFVGGGHVSGALLIKKAGKEPVLFYNDMERDEAAKSGLKTVSFSEFPIADFEARPTATACWQMPCGSKRSWRNMDCPPGGWLCMAKWNFPRCSAS